ncbi:class IV lanthionine synthetase LanL [Streptomyces sp. CB01881]|uniref:class IV lanthionine synthetase LanL n=1 Tax=Streptomyces sp. CB01881 TaxID=2078691 RepID=UPI000CDCD1D7|nr:class IV lanthionine synthetase LanL [Streptomyces sp. CB01881]AUY49177.1 serine/threonine protein kinase [Streptomyces sp. CB01881]TYC77667.1 serine/threonine protein kinase [Streptomyces sp. CB01881]
MTESIAGRSGWSDDTWSYLNDPRMPAMDHGWKLHVSARPGDLEAVTGLVLPVLSRHVCHAKWARSPETLREINSGVSSAGAVGKAITVYPAPGVLVGLADELVAVLRGREGPQIVSDRRVDPAAPVYYRYGPFTGDYRTGRSGRLESVMVGPDGRAFDGLADGSYRCPPWAEDPFENRPGHDAGPRSSAGFGGGRYRVTGGIVRKPQGNVYRAVDLATGQPVVVKQARAFVAEDESGADTRDRLRNERTVLAALDAVPGVPRALDYFRHRSDEYLVMTSCGGRDLRREVQENGPYRPDPARPSRTVPDLAAQLLRVLDGIHLRGVVVRDLKPGNVVLDATGRCRVIDFGISALDGVGPDGSTPGYSGPVRRGTGGTAEPADDYYALGATLCFAATGMEPVIVDADDAVNRDRTLDCLAWALPGDDHRWIRAGIAGLMSFDPAVRTAGADRLRAGAPVAASGVPAAAASGVSRPSRGPGRLRFDDGLAEEVVEHTAAFCVDEARRIADPVLAARANIPTPVDVYGGSSGLGLELLHHLHRPGVRETVDALAQWTTGQSRNLSPGFYSGRTGVGLFLAEAGAGPGGHADHPDHPDGPDLPARGPDGGPPEADLIEGVAGIGIGRLLLARHAFADGDSRLADRHLAVAAACDRMLASGRARLTPAGADGIGSAALREGFAHGEAGVAYFLVEYAGATGDPAALHRARRACADLAAVTPGIIAAAAGPGATRRYGSWCRGLAGIGTVLVRAADRLGEPGHLVLAQRAARTCAALAPRMPLVNQCCGLAGVGDLMVDVARASGSEEFWNAAETVAALILSRSGGTPSRPVFPDAGLARSSATWAGGSAGVLAFFRRLHDRGGQRLGLVD